VGNLRVVVESDLGTTLEGDWGLPVELIAPDGTVYNTKAGTDDPLVGQILYDSREDDPETGAEVIVNKPVVTLRRSSLGRIPAANEKWAVRIPTVPDPAAAKTAFSLERPTELGGAIGFIRLYLVKIESSLQQMSSSASMVMSASGGLSVS
jgi:hypothetical protein